jgi:CheY-like chemotaxis protein
VLIVDDSLDTVELLRALFEGFGATVMVAQTVDGAVRAFRRRPAHAVLTDIRIGDSDGYALLDAIRRCNAEYKGFTPVIALTGYASPEDEGRAMTAGFYAYLHKPFEPDDVVGVVMKAVARPLDLAA